MLGAVRVITCNLSCKYLLESPTMNWSPSSRSTSQKAPMASGSRRCISFSVSCRHWSTASGSCPLAVVG
ncbi:unnamed protein product [Staurois parvus]|uniref:Uncharacterized protein n=1 Tax=Staurois parvus TaxID=386267 RepID=A0ABN9BYV8_9NEOB|nr:unnamed protein product [Staurois parvus]